MVNQGSPTYSYSRRRWQPSPIHGRWSSWQSWGNVNCQGGYQRRYRFCNNPPAAHGGSRCRGISSQRRDCPECSLGLAQCEHLCHNTLGSFRCSCYPGYQTSPQNWKRCERRTCDTSDWPPPSNGQMSIPCRGKSKVSYGTQCLVTCNHGFEIVGNRSSVCDISGSWNPKTTANCRVHACPPLRAPDNGQIIPEICKIKPLHGQNCSYECRSGFARFGSFSNICDNGKWTHGIFHCQENAVIQTTEVQGTRAQAPCKKFFQNFNMKMYAVMLHQHLTYHRRPNLTIRGIDQIYMIYVRVSSLKCAVFCYTLDRGEFERSTRHCMEFIITKGKSAQ
ncbi:PREDICTED: hemicentin-1-like [Acropora digitifera]|uniref:hemicentin-1-like n=1 Tax=Acropora digitifera TaxID=70779 RepID=UPI00077B22DC|nr:PREDICTED: hemicentin-1-like [Acropora digitifera]